MSGFLPVALLALTASATVYIGAILGSSTDKSSALTELLEEEGGPQELTFCQAVTFPIYASATLLTLYFFFGYVQYILIGCLVFASSTALYYLSISLVKYFCASISKYWSNIIVIISTILIVMEWIRSGNFICHNILGCSLCILFICTLRFPSLKVATICLTLLLFYDVFWVFFSEYIFTKNVMVEVATKTAINPIHQLGETLHFTPLQQISSTIELPLKLIFPTFMPNGRKIMLGLGDIALPGALVALARRSELMFDAMFEMKLKEDVEMQLTATATAAATMMTKGNNSISSNGKAKLFQYAFIGYVIGLVGAFVGNTVSGHAQPA